MRHAPDLESPTAPASPLFEPMPMPQASKAIPLAGDPADGDGKKRERWFRMAGLATVRNVTRASLTPFLPDEPRATGAAVVIAPGGGFLIGAMENEGWPQARWLADHGVAAFVLKYRLQPTPADDAAFAAALAERFRSAVVAPGERRRIEIPTICLDDGALAIELVRARAPELRLDPARIGWLGYSAGAMIGLGLANAPTGRRPSFVGAVYPSMDIREVASDAPPLFVAIAADDQLYGRQGFGLVESWHRAGRPVELHVWEHGGHGYGMGKPGTTSTGTLASFHEWLQCAGWLDDGTMAERLV